VNDPGVDTLRTFARWKSDLGFGSKSPVEIGGLVESSAIERAAAP
jgi:hypothetical protein